MKNANFCENCGKKLSKFQVPEKQIKSHEISKSSVPKNSNVKLITIIICVIAILGIMGFIGMISNVVVSEGMEPVLYRGDLIIVDHNPSSVQVGDIVVYNTKEYPGATVHRVKEIYKTSNGSIYFITKGDNNPTTDSYPVQFPDQVISKVVNIGGQPLVIPKLGYPVLWIRGL